MAKRKRLAPPTPDELAEMEADFAPKPKLGAMAPIAQVAGDAAAQASPLPAADRAAMAQDQTDAVAYRAAVANGALLQDLPLDLIEADQMTRDRIDLASDDMAELVQSIRSNGVRLPIEVFALTGEGAGRFGLISGYRRLMAVRQLHAETGAPEFAQITAIVKDESGLAAAFTAMVEENEIRADLSQYERGRIAALAAHQGAFAGIDEAVAQLFFAASKAKRSKVRSFAMIHEELGDLLTYPQQLTERMGLRLANALRSGLGPDMRAALAERSAVDAAGEWAALEPWIVQAEADDSAKRSRGGRRTARRKPSENSQFDLGQGRQMQARFDGKSLVFQVEGPGITADKSVDLAGKIAKLLADL